MACYRPLRILACVMLALSAGCASQATIQAKIQRIETRHGVVVRADNALSRCCLFGNLPALLDRIEEDLDASPEFFKRNIGPVIIEESFLDNPATYPLPFLVRGYVDPAEAKDGFPVHMKNRSVLERLLLFAPRDGEVFLHEATHSFELRLWTERPDLWQAFQRDFTATGGPPYLPPYVGPLMYCAATSILPPLGYLRVRGMPSLYGWLDHFEDVAETHCYWVRHKRDVGFLRDTDPVLHRKCYAVQRFVQGQPGEADVILSGR